MLTLQLFMARIRRAREVYPGFRFASPFSRLSDARRAWKFAVGAVAIENGRVEHFPF